jgi:hypothetical protein
MNLTAVAKSVGKSVPFVMNLQKQYGLTTCKSYSTSYVVVVKKLAYLSVCSVPIKDIKALLKSERRLLELLKVDSLQESTDWFESLCTVKAGPTRLLLSGYDIGHELSGNTVQAGLDFSERDKELFGEGEMGSDALVGLRLYVTILEGIQAKMRKEAPVLQQALRWNKRVT